MNTARRSLSTLFTHFLMEKDQLTANFTRFGAGFILDSQIKEAREQVNTISSLLTEIEQRKFEPKKFIPTESAFCGSCYRK